MATAVWSTNLAILDVRQLGNQVTIMQVWLIQAARYLALALRLNF